MRGPWLAVLAVGLAFAWPAPSRGDFMWMGNWQVNKFDAIGGPGTTVQPTFGDVTADLANAGGSMAASSDPNTVNSGGFLMVTFVRQFKLFNDPNDSLVTLFGTLSGTLNATSKAPGISADAGAISRAQIVNTLTSIAAGDAALAINSTDNTFVLMPKDDSELLPDGMYTLSGSLRVDVTVNQAPVGIADANANVNWIVGISAVSVPEPPAFLQLSVGASVLLVWLRWRRTRGPARAETRAGD